MCFFVCLGKRWAQYIMVELVKIDYEMINKWCNFPKFESQFPFKLSSTMHIFKIPNCAVFAKWSPVFGFLKGANHVHFMVFLRVVHTGRLQTNRASCHPRPKK